MIKTILPIGPFLARQSSVKKLTNEKKEESADLDGDPVPVVPRTDLLVLAQDT